MSLLFQNCVDPVRWRDQPEDRSAGPSLHHAQQRQRQVPGQTRGVRYLCLYSYY